jgi:predicted RNase H-like HicB family nuclease
VIPKKETITFKVQVFFEKEEGGGYHTYVPSLKGLHSCGDTIEAAKRNTVDAIGAFITSLIKHGDPIPLTCIHHGEFQSSGKHIPSFRNEFIQVTV